MSDKKSRKKFYDEVKSVCKGCPVAMTDLVLELLCDKKFMDWGNFALTFEPLFQEPAFVEKL